MQGESKSELWSARLREHSESGLNIRSWCVLEGVTEATFHYWRKRLSGSAACWRRCADVGDPSRHGVPGHGAS